MYERKRIWKETQDNWYDGIIIWTNQLIGIIREDIPGFIKYLKEECSSEDFLYISDMFEEIFAAVTSHDLVAAFRDVLKTRFKMEDNQYNISKDLDEAILLQKGEH